MNLELSFIDVTAEVGHIVEDIVLVHEGIVHKKVRENKGCRLRPAGLPGVFVVRSIAEAGVVQGTSAGPSERKEF